MLSFRPALACSYPAYGRWRVHNLYVEVVQPVPQYGVSQPYQVLNVYRF